MTQSFTFEDYLKETWANSPASDGVYKDAWPDAFDAWLEGLDGAELLEYGDKYGIELTKRLAHAAGLADLKADADEFETKQPH